MFLNSNDIYGIPDHYPVYHEQLQNKVSMFYPETLTNITIQKIGVGKMFMFLKDISYVQQGCIYLNI